jgi:Na+-translocating ferredoxin:NAD+ oxidoreductase RnfG subunit
MTVNASQKDSMALKNSRTPKENDRNNVAKSLAAMLLILVILAGMIYGVNKLLTPQFQKNQVEAERKIPRMVLPEGDVFDKYDGTLVTGVSACYVAANGAGIAVVVDQVISHGDIQIMVGVNQAGQITAVSILSQEYTKGKDAGINNPDYLSVYVGKTVLSADNISEDYEIDSVPGAEEASNAVYQAVKIAFLQQSVIENANDQASKKAATGGGN